MTIDSSFVETLKSDPSEQLIDSDKTKSNEEKELIKRLEEEVKTEEKLQQSTDLSHSTRINEWDKLVFNKSKAPFQRKGHSAVVADTYMIIFGGCYMDRKCFNDVNFLDLRYYI